MRAASSVSPGGLRDAVVERLQQVERASLRSSVGPRRAWRGRAAGRPCRGRASPGRPPACSRRSSSTRPPIGPPRGSVITTKLGQVLVRRCPARSSARSRGDGLPIMHAAGVHLQAARGVRGGVGVQRADHAQVVGELRRVREQAADRQAALRRACANANGDFIRWPTGRPLEPTTGVCPCRACRRISSAPAWGRTCRPGSGRRS